MGGMFAVISERDCSEDEYFGTDYHTHIGSETNAGLAIFDGKHIKNQIHDISEIPFQSKFFDFSQKVKGPYGIGVMSDYDPQPLTICSRIGNYAIATVGTIKNLDSLVEGIFKKSIPHFEISGGEFNQTELTASLINQGSNFIDGISIAQNEIEGSCSLMLLTEEGVYLARDKFGRTPIILGEKDGYFAAASETLALENLEYKITKDLGPGEIGFLSNRGYEQLKKSEDILQICSFLWVYYGHPASSYEGINVEVVRNKCGEMLAKYDDDLEIDYVTGIPDSGIGHAKGYSNARKIDYRRPTPKYNQTWGRSFMPDKQEKRNVVANKKLTWIPELINGFKLKIVEDSIVRGTQLKKTIKRFWDYGAKEIHMGTGCPPILRTCRYLNFSRSKREEELAAVRAITKLENKYGFDAGKYRDENSDKYFEMVNQIKKDFDFTTLRYQKLEDMIKAIGLPREKLCLYCWTGK